MRAEEIDQALETVAMGTTLAPGDTPVAHGAVTKPEVTTRPELLGKSLRRALVGGTWELHERSSDSLPDPAVLTAARARRDALDLAARLATVPAWSWASVGSDEFRARVQPKLRVGAERWSPRENPRLVLTGKAGSGKTAAAIAACWRLGIKTLWTSARDLTTARREHPLGQGAPPLLERAATVALLVLDDLGTEQTTAETVDVLHGVLDKRYLADLPTVTTTPLTAEELQARYGAGVTRRIVDRAKWVLA